MFDRPVREPRDHPGVVLQEVEALAVQPHALAAERAASRSINSARCTATDGAPVNRSISRGEISNSVRPRHVWIPPCCPCRLPPRNAAPTPSASSPFTAFAQSVSPAPTSRNSGSLENGHVEPGPAKGKPRGQAADAATDDECTHPRIFHEGPKEHECGVEV